MGGWGEGVGVCVCARARVRVQVMDWSWAGLQRLLITMHCRGTRHAILFVWTVF